MEIMEIVEANVACSLRSLGYVYNTVRVLAFEHLCISYLLFNIPMFECLVYIRMLYICSNITTMLRFVFFLVSSDII